MTRAFVFDIDGTLVDSVDLHARAWQEAFLHFGREIPFEEVRSQIGKGGDQLMPVFLPKEEVERRGEEISGWRADHFRREYMPRVRAFPKVGELFERVKADGKRIAIASSSKADEVEQYKEIMGVSDLVDVETSADDAEKSKPHPDIFQAAIGKLGLRAQEVVVFGDSPYDAEAARRINAPVVGVLCGGFPEADLRAAGCAAIFRDPAELLRHYEALAELAPRVAA
jgi:HAD superfamily hydrolase (TIGR01509 family)